MDASPDKKQAAQVVQLMVLSAWADGRVVGSEAVSIQRMVTRLPLLEGVALAKISREMRAKLEAEGMDICLIDACRGLRDTEYRELAFQCCARVMGADADFALSEESVLKKLQQLLALSVPDMRRLLVLATKRDY